MLKQEAENVIERIREDLKRHGVLIGYDPEFTTAEFGCDLDHHVAQVREDPNNRVLQIAIHDEGLWNQLQQGNVYRCSVSECRGKLFGIPITIEPRDDESYTIEYRL
ncbi:MULTISPECIES: hypothetical protein [unclassified Pseudomonas]|uniref:hypothetical protein n=1 Tax=Pseudomonas TaxID=286 RepID=UPI00164917B6|nr:MULTISPECIES: hypothetical protein [unclassified Pseudomonas]MBC3423905.1 hypothetical protein [Pseudomonas sp. RW3S2]MBC3465990.1 hypothetical protein [Pseudomonas sp. RW10S2]